MNKNPDHAMDSDCGEETLRLIAGLPAPAGLEERVHKALGAAPRESRGGGRVLAWPARLRASGALENHWMRAAAAAAIVFVVVGGGWGVYRRVQPGAGKVIVMPAREPGAGRFGSSGAVRTPTTIPGPKDREQGSEGASHPGREQGTLPTAKKAPKKPVTAQPAASEPTPQRAVTR